VKRVFLPLCLAMVTIAATAVPVLAAKPERVPFGAPPPQDFAAGDMCADFPVRIETLVNKEYGLVFPEAADGSQRTIVTGRLVIRVTNLETDEALTLNASGPGVFTVAADGTLTITGWGRWLLYLLPTDAGGPGIWLTSGRLTLHIGDTGIVGLELPAHTTDICAALAQ
jgi:hypothetical protein